MISNYSEISGLINKNQAQNNRLKNLVLFEVGTYSLGLFAMNELWYKNYPKSNFHFINDNSSWLQMDKMGHSSNWANSSVISSFWNSMIK